MIDLDYMSECRDCIRSKRGTCENFFYDRFRTIAQTSFEIIGYFLSLSYMRIDVYTRLLK